MFQRSRTTARQKPQIGSVRALARACGNSHTTIIRWCARDDWPFRRAAPWPASDVRKMLVWAEAHLRDDAVYRRAESRDPVNRALRQQRLEAEVRKITAEAAHAENDRDELLGSLIRAEEVEREWADLRETIRSAFAHVPDEFTRLCVAHGLPPEETGEFRKEVEQAVAGCLSPMDRRMYDD